MNSPHFKTKIGKTRVVQMKIVLEVHLSETIPFLKRSGLSGILRLHANPREHKKIQVSLVTQFDSSDKKE